MEKFFLGAVFSGKKLNVINQQCIHIPVITFKFIHGVGLQCSHHISNKALRVQIQNLRTRVVGNDLIANSRLVSRVSNVPDFINKMLTKGSKLLINGISIPYNETDLHMQTVNILVQYLHKKTSRDLIMDILEYLKDRSNHRKIMAMGNIGYAFNSIDSLKQGLADRFLKQTILKSAVHSEKLNQTPINWNDIIIDLAISMGIGIALLSDNRIKASDCAHVVSQAEECSDEPITTLNASIKLLKLEYINLENN